MGFYVSVKKAPNITLEIVQDDISMFIQNGTGLTWTYNDPSNTFTGNVSLSAFTTDNLSEGSTNKYFTDERVDDRVAALLSAGSGISLSYNDPANTLTISSAFSLNGLTGATQTFAVGSSGSDFNISSATTVHTFNLPDAGLATRGVINFAAQTFGGQKTFNSNVLGNSFQPNLTNVTSASGTTTLTVDSSQSQRLTGSLNQSFKMPVATTLRNGWFVDFFNGSSGTLTVKNNASTTLYTVPSGGRIRVSCSDASTTNGTWFGTPLMPANANYGTAGMIITGFHNVNANTDAVASLVTQAGSGSIAEWDNNRKVMELDNNGKLTLLYGNNSDNALGHVGNTIHADTTPIATTSSGVDTDLMSWPIPSLTLQQAIDGQRVIFEMDGYAGTSGSVCVFINGEPVSDTFPVEGASTWHVRGYITHISSDGGIHGYVGYDNDNDRVKMKVFDFPGMGVDSALTLKIVANDSGGDPITQKYFCVDWKDAITGGRG